MNMQTIAKPKTESVEEVKQQPAQLCCSGCGVTIDAACNCHLPYVPAGVAAAKAIEAHPEKSNVAIAKKIGVHESTVREARKTATSGNPEVVKRIGLDGKARRLPENKRPERKPAEQTYLQRVDKAKAFAKIPYTGKVIEETIALARSVADAWNEFADKLGQRRALN